MRVVAALVSLFLLGLFTLAGQAASVSVQNLRMWRAPDHTRLVFDLNGPLEHRVFALSNPDRVVIDFKHAHLLKPLPALKFDGPLIRKIRSGQPTRGALRVVIDLKRATKPRSFILKPFQNYGYRLVLDLDHGTEKPAAPVSNKSKRVAPPGKTGKTAKPVKPRRPGTLIIAIDAGHGGEDPGAIGRRYRTKEKKVVLRIARDLKRLIDSQRGMRAVMIRKGDYYVPLPKRARLAQASNARIFVSIHADSLPRGRAHGASVYALSQRGATSRFAKELEKQSNASDFIGGFEKIRDPLVKKVVEDMRSTGNIISSIELGRDILRGLRSVSSLHSSKVEQAGFIVLKSPKMQSVLIETAFISNPADEKKLRTRRFQRRIARGIFNGIKRYAKRGGVRPTVAASSTDKLRHHIVRRGDTLSGIAHRYGVRIQAIQLANNLSGSRVRIGERLRIP